MKNSSKWESSPNRGDFFKKWNHQPVIVCTFFKLPNCIPSSCSSFCPQAKRLSWLVGSNHPYLVTHLQVSFSRKNGYLLSQLLIMIRTAQLNLAKWPVTEPYLGLVVISHALVARLALPTHDGKVSHLWYIGAWDKKVPEECAELHKHQGIQKTPRTRCLVKNMEGWDSTCQIGWIVSVIYLGYGPFPVTVTTRIITFLVGNPYKPLFATVTGKGPHPIYII